MTKEYPVDDLPPQALPETIGYAHEKHAGAERPREVDPEVLHLQEVQEARREQLKIMLSFTARGLIGVLISLVIWWFFHKSFRHVIWLLPGFTYTTMVLHPIHFDGPVWDYPRIPTLGLLGGAFGLRSSKLAVTLIHWTFIFWIPIWWAATYRPDAMDIYLMGLPCALGFAVYLLIKHGDPPGAAAHLLVGLAMGLPLWLIGLFEEPKAITLLGQTIKFQDALKWMAIIVWQTSTAAVVGWIACRKIFV